MLLFISAVAVVLLVSFLCSIFESVLLSLTRPQIEVMTANGQRAGKMLADFKSNMDSPIAAILILNTAAHTIGAAVAGASYTNVFPASTLWIFSLIFTLAVLLFTEIIPKTMGVTYARSLATPVAHGIRWLSILLHPLVWVSERLSRALRGNAEQPVTSQEEIRLLAILGRSEGVVGERTADIIVGATQLRDLTAGDVMLPRDSVAYLTADLSRAAVLARMNETGHSRFPFAASGDLSEATSVVLAKNLLQWLLAHPDSEIDWPTLTTDALVVPESVSLPKLLRIFQESRRHLALVVDEYGSIVGIVTMEDVLEEMVGEIDDEKDIPNEAIRKTEAGWVARGDLDLRRLASSLDARWDPDSDVASVGGLLAETLERIPRIGDELEWQGYLLRVIRADRRRARVIEITPLPSVDEDES
ncbi:MAG: hemolysin family protein [Pseudomonadota bacterium]